MVVSHSLRLPYWAQVWELHGPKRSQSGRGRGCQQHAAAARQAAAAARIAVGAAAREAARAARQLVAAAPAQAAMAMQAAGIANQQQPEQLLQLQANHAQQLPQGAATQQQQQVQQPMPQGQQQAQQPQQGVTRTTRTSGTRGGSQHGSPESTHFCLCTIPSIDQPGAHQLFDSGRNQALEGRNQTLGQGTLYPRGPQVQALPINLNWANHGVQLGEHPKHPGQCSSTGQTNMLIAHSLWAGHAPASQGPCHNLPQCPD